MYGEPPQYNAETLALELTCLVERMWKEAVVDEFKAVFWNVSKDRRSLGRDLNPGTLPNKIQDCGYKVAETE
jgi:hypothetical protein